MLNGPNAPISADAARSLASPDPRTFELDLGFSLQPGAHQKRTDQGFQMGPGLQFQSKIQMGYESNNW